MNGKTMGTTNGNQRTYGKKHIMHLLEEYEDRDFIHERIDTMFTAA